MNALNYMGADSTMKAFYDIVCQGQIAELPEDGAQMELARSAVKFDMVAIHENEIPLWMAITKVVNKNTDIASTVKPVIEESRTALIDILNAYMK